MTTGRRHSPGRAVKEIRIRPMGDNDWAGVRAVYAEGIQTGNATFEEAPPSWTRWASTHRPDCRLVAVHEGRIVGWAALSPVSARRAYEGVVEASVYVAAGFQRLGIRKRLMSALIAAAEAAGVWTIQMAIFPENEPSLRLADQCGFRLVGVRERIGKLRGRWRDVCLLERRSALTGT